MHEHKTEGRAAPEGFQATDHNWKIDLNERSTPTRIDYFVGTGVDWDAGKVQATDAQLIGAVRHNRKPRRLQRQVDQYQIWSCPCQIERRNGYSEVYQHADTARSDAAILKAKISAVTLRQENRNVVARYCGQGQLWAPVIHNLVVLRTHKLFAYRSPLLHYAWRARVEKPTRNHRGTSKWCHRAKVAHQRKRLTRLACLLVFIHSYKLFRTSHPGLCPLSRYQEEAVPAG